MTCQIPEIGEDCTDMGNGSSMITRIDEFLDKIRLTGEEIMLLKTNLSSPTNSQSKPLVKQVCYMVPDFS